MKIIKRMTVLILLVLIGGLNTVHAQTQRESLEYEENSVIGLNYHRVREYGLFEKALQVLSNSRELSIYSVSTDEFRDQIEWLVEQDANFLTLEELLDYKEKGTFPEKSVWISFDDMDETTYYNAHPILEEYSIPATGFVITDQVGNENFNHISLMNEEQLNEIYASGLWEFASHTANLHNLEGKDSLLTKGSSDEIREDLGRSVEYLTSSWEKVPPALAYPYGMGNDKVNEEMKRLGMNYGFTLDEKVITADENDYYMPRVLITDSAFDRLIKTWGGFADE